jgi:glycosyltransferase involved in cell wall biosynthesis
VIRVSVIIPAYNAERTLQQTLESVRNQSTPVAEIIVVDDGSTDGTATVARSFHNVVLLSQDNAGPGAALNLGEASSSGHVLIFLDADDLLPAGAVSAHLALLSMRRDCDGSVGQMEEFICPSEDSEAARRFRPRERQTCWLAGGIALRREAVRRIGPFDTQLTVGHWIDWMDRAKLAGLTFCVHGAIVLHRRLHSASLSMRSEVSKGKGLILMARQALLRRKRAEAETLRAREGSGMQRETEE